MDQKTTNTRTAVKNPLLNNKTYLYLTEFFAGMAVMAVELGASRLLAPYFSSSQIVWTIIIGTIMIAMALGNIMGGRWADKDPNPDRLYGRIIVAAVWIGLIPVLGKPLILAISAVIVFTVNTGFLVAAAFAACMVIFVFPLFLLGTVTPSLVKYTVDTLDDSGKIVGMLNASNTIGCIIGTFVPTFISIPTVGTAITFLIFAGILLLLSVLYFAAEKARPAGPVLGLILFLLSCFFGHTNSFAFWENDLTYEGESVYNYLQVTEDDERVILSTNVLFGVQSVYHKQKSLTGMYYDVAMAAPYMAGVKEKKAFRILILGMGTGTYATQCSRYFDNVTAEGVEIDEKITALARKYFELPENVTVTTYDGRAFLQDQDIRKKYDVIMVDAYQDITIPFQMSSVEFFTLVRNALTEDGVMVVNMNMKTDTPGGINEYLADTICRVFHTVCTADVSNNTNRELFASNDSGIIERFSDGLKQEPDEELARLMESVKGSLKPYESTGKLLTDDKAPVELLSMRAIDGLIREEVYYYRKVFEKDGVNGLLQSF